MPPRPAGTRHPPASDPPDVLTLNWKLTPDETDALEAEAYLRGDGCRPSKIVQELVRCHVASLLTQEDVQAVVAARQSRRTREK
jgi:hypothetical protein